MTYEEKLHKLEQIIKEYPEMTLALSGGVDSVFLLLFSHGILGDRLAAVTAQAPNFAPDEVAYAAELCQRHGIRHLPVPLGDSFLDVMAGNPPDRCYHCKKEIFTRLRSAVDQSFPGAVLCDGTNLDDLKDYRPGRRALEELQICSPLKEAGLTKGEIRRALKELGGEIWSKPAFACLASRIPYGDDITAEKLTAIYKAEAALRQLGFAQVRVRHHGNLARIEVEPSDMARFADPALTQAVTAAVKASGFLYVTLDLAGYRMGSLNEDIK